MQGGAGGQEPEELTVFVQNLLAQMVRDLSAARLRRSPLHTLHAAFFTPRTHTLHHACAPCSTSPSLRPLQQSRFQAMSDAIITKIDEMGERIDELEKNISELMVTAGGGGSGAAAAAQGAAAGAPAGGK